MKKFRFPLLRVLEWRRQQREVQAGLLEQRAAELRSIEGRRARVEREETGARKKLASLATAEAHELATLDGWIRDLRDLRRRLERERDEAAHRVAVQRQAVVDAERQVRLLERLQHQQHEKWSQAVAREIEALAQELYLSRWNR